MDEVTLRFTIICMGVCLIHHLHVHHRHPVGEEDGVEVIVCVGCKDNGNTDNSNYVHILEAEGATEAGSAEEEIKLETRLETKLEMKVEMAAVMMEGKNKEIIVSTC